MRTRNLVWLGLAAWACVAPVARAQFIGGGNPYQQMTPFSQPALSPYLDLLRGGNPAANYFLGVLPEQARRADASRLNNAFNLYNSASQPPPASFDLEESDNLKSLPPSGHSAGFMFYGTYYNFGNRQRPYFPLPFNQGGGQQGGINLLPRR